MAGDIKATGLTYHFSWWRPVRTMVSDVAGMADPSVGCVTPV